MKRQEWKYKGYYICYNGQSFDVYSHFYMWNFHCSCASLEEAKTAIDNHLTKF